MKSGIGGRWRATMTDYDPPSPFGYMVFPVGEVRSVDWLRFE